MSLKSSLRLDPITRRVADAFIDAHHERGATQAATLYLGLFWEGALHGVFAWGAPVANNAGQMLGLRAREVFELRRMVLDDVPPRNAESRALAVATSLISARYPHFAALITYCGLDEEASAYRACGWKRIATAKNMTALTLTQTGEKISIQSFHHRYGPGAERRVPHTPIVTPTQKLALGLTPAVRACIDALSACLV